jgi:molecular chaperone HscB
MNYFELFSLTPGYQLDLSDLAGRYRTLQSQFHPDKFAGESAQAQAIAMQRAAQINDAYQTLKAPLSRAQYLLSLQGIELAGEQKTVNDVEFLMLQMELREQLEGLNAAADPEDAIDKLAARLNKDRCSLSDDFESAYNEGHYQQAGDIVRKLKFFARLEQQLQQAEEQLLDF